MRDMNSVSALAYMAGHNLDPYIQEMHEIIDDRLILLKEWEEESDTVYLDPYVDIENLIALEYTYQLSKVGITPESVYNNLKRYQLPILQNINYSVLRRKEVVVFFRLLAAAKSNSPTKL